MEEPKSTIISWWNTGLTPPTTKKRAKGKRSLIHVVSVLQKMVNSGSRIIGLCELSDDDITNPIFVNFLLANGLKCKSFYKKDRNMIWDIAFVYDDRLFVLIESFYLSADMFTNQKKLGIKIDGRLYGHLFRLFISHFPGRMTREIERINMFRELIAQVHADADFCRYSIVMGDFNVELCSNGVLDSLSRSREYAVSANKMYTPFIRHLGEKYEYGHHREVSGTLRIGAKWEFFDFISTTRHFFHSDSVLMINDFKCGIWDELLNSSEEMIDHLPVYITVEQKEK